MLRHMPVFPMFGSGETRLQPAYVEDVAEAIVRVLPASAVRQLYELAGPRVYTYQELLKTIAASVGTRPFLSGFRSAYGMSLDSSQKLCRLRRSPEIKSN